MASDAQIATRLLRLGAKPKCIPRYDQMLIFSSTTPALNTLIMKMHPAHDITSTQYLPCSEVSVWCETEVSTKVAAVWSGAVKAAVCGVFRDWTGMWGRDSLGLIGHRAKDSTSVRVIPVGQDFCGVKCHDSRDNFA